MAVSIALLVAAGCGVDDASGSRGHSQIAGSGGTQATGTGAQATGTGSTQTAATGGAQATSTGNATSTGTGGSGGTSGGGGTNGVSDASAGGTAGVADASAGTRDADASRATDSRVDTGTRPEAGGTEAGDARGNTSACGLSGQTNLPPNIATCNCGGVEGNATDANRCIRVENRCSEAIRFHASGADTPSNVLNGQAASLAPGACKSYVLSKFSAGRLWAETCPGGATCIPGPYTLSEFTLGGTGVGADIDYYDLSLVDGYNVAMAIRPVPGTFTPGTGKYNCGTPLCSCDDILTSCPAELRVTSMGSVGLCKSGCAATGQAQYCCQGAFNSPQTCPPTTYSTFFKTRCPDAYSYAYDDQASTYTCGGGGRRPDYDIIFCP